MVLNQTNPSAAPMASWNNKAQQHHHKKTVPEYRLRVAAELGLFVAIASLVLVYTFSYFNLSAMCFSDTVKVKQRNKFEERYGGTWNLLCPVLKLINHHVSMSKLVPWIEFFSYLVIRWALAVFILVGCKIHSHSCCYVPYFVHSRAPIIRYLFNRWDRPYNTWIIIHMVVPEKATSQQPNGREKLQPNMEPKSCFEMYP